MDKIIDLFFNGFSIAGIVVGLYLLLSGLNLKYVKTYFLKAWLIVIISQIVFYLLNLNKVMPNDWMVNYFGFPLCLLHMPLFYLAIVDITKIRKIKPLEVLLHCMPYIMYVGGLIFIAISTNKTVYVVNGFLGLPRDLPHIVYYFIGIPLALSGFIYSAFCLITMVIYKRRLKANFSNTDKRQLHWINYLVWTIFLLFLLIYLVITFRVDFKFINGAVTFKLVNIFLFFFLFAFGIKYQKQLIYFIKNKVESLKPLLRDKYLHSALTSEGMNLISEKLNILMASEKMYLNEYLTLQQVSVALNESTQNISQTLNEHLKTTFYNYVNRYRLNLAEKKLRDSQFSKLSIIGIAMDCGFKSKSTFYKLFKQKTGKTPSEYRDLE